MINVVLSCCHLPVLARCGKDVVTMCLMGSGVCLTVGLQLEPLIDFRLDSTTRFSHAGLMLMLRVV